MFEITQLKEKKLSELQEIAKELKISRYSSLKKLDLIYQILDVQAASPVEKKPQEQKNQPKEESRTDQKNNLSYFLIHLEENKLKYRNLKVQRCLLGVVVLQ